MREHQQQEEKEEDEQVATSNSSSSKWEEQQEGVVDTHSLPLPNWMLSMLIECCHGASLTLQLC